MSNQNKQCGLQPFFCDACTQINLRNIPLKCGFPTQLGLTVRLPPAGLGEVLLGRVSVAQLQRGHPGPVERFGVPRPSLQHAQAVALDPGIVHALFLEQTGWEGRERPTNAVSETLWDRMTSLGWGLAERFRVRSPNVGCFTSQSVSLLPSTTSSVSTHRWLWINTQSISVEQSH